jgi:type IV pilus assembly protein PilW
MEWVDMEVRGKESAMNMRENCGFTLIELLIAIALGLVILAGLYQTFRTQQDTYIVQDQVAAMQQNLRGAMYLITRDLQMAGWYSNFDRNKHNIDWDDQDGDNNPVTNPENGRPLLFSVDNNATAGDGINDGTDMLVIVKGGDEHRLLTATESAGGTSISLSSYDLDGDGQADLNTGSKKYGLLVKSDLRSADFFVVDSTSGTITNPWNLNESYLSGDTVFRSDIIVYKVNNDATTGRPMLYRRNLGNDNGYQPVAENIENLQVRYQLNSGSWVDALSAANQAQVRAVEVFLVGRTALPQRGFIDRESYNFANNPNPNPGGPYRRKVLSTIVKTRNVGL